MRTYATEADVQEWSGTTDPVAPSDIRAASALVENATRLDHYDVDADGHPTSGPIAEAFREATCEQVAGWSAAGINVAAGAVGQSPRITSQSVPAGSVSYASPIGTAELGAAATSLSTAAALILRNAGLMRDDVRIL